jgi:hypothetical protein
MARDVYVGLNRSFKGMSTLEKSGLAGHAVILLTPPQGCQNMGRGSRSRPANDPSQLGSQGKSQVVRRESMPRHTRRIPVADLAGEPEADSTP